MTQGNIQKNWQKQPKVAFIGQIKVLFHHVEGFER